MAWTLALALPGATTPTRAEFYGLRWLVERRDSGLFCVAMADTLRFEGYLGLPDEDVEARLELRAPEHPVEVTLRNGVVLAPAAKLEGWLPVPVHQRLVVSGSFGDATLVTITDPDLRVGWREDEGYHHVQEETFRDSPEPGSRDAHRLWLRLAIDNPTREAVQAKRCPLPLAGCDILQEHGLAMGPRVHWTLGESGSIRLEAPRAPILSPQFKRADASSS